MEDDQSGEPGGRVFAWVARAVVLAIALLFMSFAPFRHGSSRIDLANDVIEFTNRTWWGLVASVDTRTTWVGEHHAAGEVDPVWRPLDRWNSGGMLSRGWIGSSRFKFASLDHAELVDVDSAGVIPPDLRRPVADAVRTQWLRRGEDGRYPGREGQETLAQQLRYWELNDRVLTLDDLRQLEHGVPWHEVLYPE